jgi:galactose mutarotase-like enzyme
VSDRYSVEKTTDSIETLVLHDHEAKARVVLAPSRGGLVTRFEVAGDAVLYLDEATLRDPSTNVRGGIPVLFPFAGPLRGDRLELSGATMKQHGFARNLAWSADAPDTARGAAVTMRLRADDTTRAAYPFAFELAFTARLVDGSLHLEQRFENRGERPMPIQPGLHPYFALPDAKKAEARVATDAMRGYDNVTKKAVAITGRIDLTAPEVDLHLLDHRDRETRLVRPGMRDVVLAFGDDQEALVVWTLRGKDFVCVEPWSRTANALNEGRGISVAPGAAHETTLTISLG